MELKIVVSVIIGVGLLIVFTLLSFFLVQTTSDIHSDIAPISSAGSENLLLRNGQSQALQIQSNLISSSITIYNTTWLDFDGVNDVLSLNVPSSKTTISFWFKNETTSWTNVIKSGENVYVNGSLTSWNFYPYYISSDDIYIGKSDASTFLNVSIDEFRVYETELNSTEITTVYNEGR